VVPAGAQVAGRAGPGACVGACGGALYLSWEATQRVFDLLDTLRKEQPRTAELEARVTLLRTRLKHDCGIYTKSESRRRLRRPRPSPWVDQ